MWLRDGRVETVYFRTPRRGHAKFRIYKGVESQSGPPGELLRFERQLRYVKPEQLSPDALAATDLAAAWEGELGAWRAVTAPVRASDLPRAQSRVVEAARDGLDPLAAERLLGWLALRGDGLDRQWWVERGQRHIPSRRLAELRRLGIALDDAGRATVGAAVPVPLAELLEEIRTAWQHA